MLLGEFLGDEGFDVVASVGDCAATVAAVSQHLPDVALVDERMPDGSGTELLPRLLEASPKTQVYILTGAVTDALQAAARDAGAAGVFSKADDMDDIVAALK